MEPYQFKSLADDRHIRVLKLSPSPFGDHDLSCELLHVSLDKLPKFEALSYSWDAQVSSSQITCDGKGLGITTNCKAALRRLRLVQKSRLLWVDSICINQLSIPERNQQVKLMGEIYGKAKRVVVCLGESTPKSEIVLKYLKRLHGIALVSRIFSDKWRILGTINQEMGLLEAECKAHSSPNVPIIDSVIRDVFSRSWFTRLWTIQEVALSRDAVVLCGTTEIPFFVFVTGARVMSYLERKPWAENPLLGRGLLTGSVALHFRMAKKLDNYPNIWTKVLTKTIETILGREPKLAALRRSTLLQLTRDKNATDPKDKVYALYSLLSALNVSITGEIDYSRSLAKIYYRETVTAIREDDSLDVFYNITGSDNIPGLPSWVPDWSDTTSPRCTNYRFYGAAGPSAPVAKLSNDGLRLTCYCRILGFVEKVAEKVMPRLGAVENFQFQNILPTVQNWATFCGPGFTEQVGVLQRRKKYYDSEYFTLANFCEIFVRGSAPYSDPWGEVEIPQHRLEKSDPKHKKELDRMGLVWAPIATSVTTDILYQRLLDYPEFIVSEDIVTGISKALEGTPSARSYHRLVEVMSEGLVMFKTQTGFIGTALPNIQEKDEVALFAGLRMPFIVRPGATDMVPYRILGPAYVLDAMAGEYWADRPTPENYTLALG